MTDPTTGCVRTTTLLTPMSAKCNLSIRNGQLRGKSVPYREGFSKGRFCYRYRKYEIYFKSVHSKEVFIQEKLPHERLHWLYPSEPCKQTALRAGREPEPFQSSASELHLNCVFIHVFYAQTFYSNQYLPSHRTYNQDMKSAADARRLRSLPDGRRDRNDEQNRRLKVTKTVMSDPKLWTTQTVSLHRLSPHLIKAYDKISYKRYYRQFVDQKTFTKYSKLFETFQMQTRRPGVGGGQSRALTSRHSAPMASTSAAPAVESSPRRMRLWECPKSPKSPSMASAVNSNSRTDSLRANSYRILRSHSHDLRQWTACDERENSLMSVSEYNRYLGLIRVQSLTQLDAKQLNAGFNLRNISKSGTYSVSETTGRPILDPDFLFHNLVDDYKPINIEPKEDTKKKKKNGSKTMTANKIKDKYKKLEKHKKQIVKEWRRQYLKCHTVYPFSSPMGHRVMASLRNQNLEVQRVESLVRKYETYCSLKIRFRNKPDNKLNKWRAHNVERLTIGQELSQRQHTLDVHQYSFTRRQRLDKWQRLTTGIDWKSRIVALSCHRSVEVLVPKLMRCPFCRHQIDIDHSCDINAAICDTSSPKVIIEKLSPNECTKRIALRENQKRLNRSQVILNNSNSYPKMSQNSHKIITNGCHKRVANICRIDLNEEDDDFN
ncbi:unnamed protein product [Medioppia subpectinata]|uniref:Uncharacterized protein n=1 Tax=Medioppia subpectinata TaxID=1979941 RepID=A0A7R9KBN9_9ACAR|nr:unnamed protein product [Medioppia subpectinata]CAG2100498.1 unnamed protein product [Medioppia subpectinata]